MLIWIFTEFEQNSSHLCELMTNSSHTLRERCQIFIGEIDAFKKKKNLRYAWPA